MTFINPDKTYAEQAARVEALHQHCWDIRDKHSTAETDARHVNLNNVCMATNAATATLRLLHWAKQGGEDVMAAALGLASPEYIVFVVEDLLRQSRLHLLVETQFQIEALLRSLLSGLGVSQIPQGFYNAAKAVLANCAVADADQKLRLLNVAASLRNAMHTNGIHHAHKGISSKETISGVEFSFDHMQPVHCGSWFHIVTALTASLDIVDEILSSSRVKALSLAPDSYSVQKAVGP